ncbi:MAG: hypothetical protein KBH09_15180 [Saprospiraceae bacterium]|nr:hypothetical protein [Saprospiraceae bacterium]
MNLNRRELTSNDLKIIAITFMFIDHMVAGFFLHDSLAFMLLRIPGRVVAPIMCYLVAEGFFYTSNVKKYTMRLFIFAAISHFPYVLYFGYEWWQATSVIWGLLMGLIALIACQNQKIPIWGKVPIVVACCLLSMTADWNFVSVLWIIGFYYFRGQFNKQIISFVLIGFLFHLIPTYVNFGWLHFYQIGILLAIPLLALYKGQRGKQNKFIQLGFYIFYPLHLVILYIIKYIVLSA